MKTSLTEQVIRKLKYEILCGQYKPGERLPTLREMTWIFGVSRSVINAVVVDLESSGYIKIVPTKWIEVADWRNEGNLSILSDLVEFELIDTAQLDSLLESRRFIETECVRLACRAAAKEEIARLRALIVTETAESCPEKRAKYDISFHSHIAKMSGNFVYAMMVNSFSESCYKLIEKFYSDEHVLSFVSRQHGVICDAIERGDVHKAVGEMTALLTHGEDIIKTITEQEGNSWRQNTKTRSSSLED